MATNLRAALPLLLGLGLGLAAAGGAKAAVVALALEVNGETEPALESFTEIESGTSIELGPATRIEFLLYATCQSIIVEGGRISFTEQQYLVRGGELVDAKRAKCPETAVAGGQSQIGGVLMRSGGDGALKLGPKPRLALVGDGRTAYDRLRILRRDEVLFEAPLASYRLDWPEAQPPLAPGDGYALELSGGAGAARRVGFEVAERRGTPPLTVIRLD